MDTEKRDFWGPEVLGIPVGKWAIALVAAMIIGVMLLRRFGWQKPIRWWAIRILLIVIIVAMFGVPIAFLYYLFGINKKPIDG